MAASFKERSEELHGKQSRLFFVLLSMCKEGQETATITYVFRMLDGCLRKNFPLSFWCPRLIDFSEMEIRSLALKLTYLLGFFIKKCACVCVRRKMSNFFQVNRSSPRVDF